MIVPFLEIMAELDKEPVVIDEVVTLDDDEEEQLGKVGIIKFNYHLTE